MTRKKLLGQWVPAFLLIAGVALLVFIGYAFEANKRWYQRHIHDGLEVRALLLRDSIKNHLRVGPASVDAFCKQAGARAHTRITVVLPSGDVVGDSHENPAMMDNHADRPEIRRALGGTITPYSRYSYTLQQEMVYMAVPLKEENRVMAIVRTALPLTVIHTNIKSMLVKLGAGGGIVILCILAAGLFLSRRISRPLRRMTVTAEKFAAGDLSDRAPVPSSQELAQLAEAMNRMAVQLDDKITTIQQQRNENEAVLSHMVEGVIAVDAEERLIHMNPAAALCTGIDAEFAKGRPIQEVIRHAELQQFISDVLSYVDPVERQIMLHREDERCIQAYGIRLDTAHEHGIAAIVVLHDITHLRRLENVRRDFVANVSHELKTPLTTIKGFVETLLDGAMNDRDNAERFLGIIRKNTERLFSIIEDLLSLSRLEQENGESAVIHRAEPLGVVLKSAAEVCAEKAQAQKIAIRITCPDTLHVNCNAPLLEQAVINLIDNAIKYSDPETSVSVTAERDGDEVSIQVIDSGCGIAKEHWPRLFERFYRIDRARSRELGGTGLGLSIVKHIAQAHQGRVDVTSAVGKGSTFTIYLPLNR